MVIPRIMHSMWYDANDDDNEGPPLDCPTYHEYQRQWRQLHPEWSHMFWNRRLVGELWEQPQLKPWREFFNSLRRLIEKCDYSRYAILWLYGGVYHDLDFIPLKSLNPLIQNREFGWCYEPRIHWSIDHWWVHRIANSFLMSRSGHWLWPELMTEIQLKYHPDQSVLLNTGTIRLSLFAESLDLRTEHPEYFIDMCQVMPLDSQNHIAKECPSNALETALCYTKWHEGTNWGSTNPVINRLMSNWQNPSLALLGLVLLVMLIVWIVRS